MRDDEMLTGEPLFLYLVYLPCTKKHISIFNPIFSGPLGQDVELSQISRIIACRANYNIANIWE